MAPGAGGVKAAFVFPGQGSQKVGMGRDWCAAFPEARAAFAEADAVLPELASTEGFRLSALCFDGPVETLQRTAVTQPAILTASVAIDRVLAARGERPAMAAGHSLGEYSAHGAAGTLRFADALRLVRLRGLLMQEAVPLGEGAMAAILGLDAAAVAEIARQASQGTEVCAVANFNSPEQTVLAGHAAAVGRAMTLAKERGAKRALPLPVSAPFHSPLMAPAREGLRPRLEETEFADPRCPVVVNVDARPVRTGAAARDALVRQVDEAVRWVESVRWMAEEGAVTTFVEVGPGTVLTGLGKRIAPQARWLSLAEPGELDAALDALAGGGV
jgi:[acyl-carrier-protein] S-malonyltransferase